MEVEANDSLPFLDVLVMKRGPKLATKVYRKPTRTGRYQHFKSAHPSHVKREIVHIVDITAKVIYRVERIWRRKLRAQNMIWYLTNTHKNLLIPLWSHEEATRPSSDRLYHGTVLIPYVKIISKKFRRNRNRLNVGILFKINIDIDGNWTC
jgi:hypothetical protein